MIIAFTGYAVSVYSAPEEHPVAVVAEPVFEHPPMSELNTVLHDFRIQNTGMSELQISKVRTD